MEMASFRKLFSTAAQVLQLCWSLSPFYRPQDKVREPLLSGTFRASVFVDGERWRFEPDYADGYRLTFDGAGREPYSATLFRVTVAGRDALFLDLAPERGSSDVLVRDSTLTGHTVYRVEFLEDGLSLSPLRASWAQEDQALRRRKLHEIEYRPVLFEETSVLRTMLRRALASPGAFEGPYKLTRIPSMPETARP
ncbi:MAG: hypothetical protein HY925_15655 [Elusimicrobia bacterium]|nr:hypothetical protein [Elusimicrobiota bacterium]